MRFFVYGTIIFGLLSNILAVSSSCPKDWIQIGCSCFLVSSSPQALTWDAAKKLCSGEHKAQLANIESGENKEVLGKQLNSKDAWVGARTATNSPLLTPTTARDPKQVNDATCLAIRETNIWNAKNCDEHHRFICKKPLDIKGCPPRIWKSFKNSCYWISEAKVTYQTAQANCSGMGASLAEILTRNEYEFVRRQLHDDQFDVWFGLSKLVNTTMYRYSKSVPNYDAIGVRFIPVPESPETFRRKKCVTMTIGKNNVSSFTLRCNAQINSYVCETERNEELKITITEVHETTARIMVSSLKPSKCKMPKNGAYRLTLYEENSVKLRKNLTTSDLVQDLGSLRPNTEYKVEITGHNLLSTTERFQTTKISNPLELLKNITSVNVQANIGATVNLLCAARGEPPINFIWKKNNEKIERYVDTDKPYRSSILSVTVTDETSYGDYYCLVKDKYSNTTQKIQISSIPIGKDSDDNDKWLIVVIVLLATTVAILLIITIFSCNYVRSLKHKLRQTRKENSVKLTNVSNDGDVYDRPLENTPEKAINDYGALTEVQVDDELAPYTALKRSDKNDVEDDHYAKLNDVPLYVNAAQMMD